LIPQQLHAPVGDYSVALLTERGSDISLKLRYGVGILVRLWQMIEQLSHSRGASECVRFRQARKRSVECLNQLSQFGARCLDSAQIRLQSVTTGGRCGDGSTCGLALLEDIGHLLSEHRLCRFKSRNRLIQLGSLGPPRGGCFDSFAARHENMLAPSALDVYCFYPRSE
jgi:hypothetical protein